LLDIYKILRLENNITIMISNDSKRV